MNDHLKPIYIKKVHILKYVTMCQILLFLLTLTTCNPGKKTYTSDCDEGQTFKRISYTHLIDSLAYYDQQYVEIIGRYQEGKAMSALFGDSTFTSLNKAKALWVNFSQDCPLYLKGTQKGFFEYYEGGFAKINNKKMRLRGKVDARNHGHLKQYKGCIDRVSLIEL
jgi:hypothetical protein